MYGFVVSIGCANWTKPGFCKRRAAAAANCTASSVTALRRTSEAMPRQPMRGLQRGRWQRGGAGAAGLQDAGTRPCCRGRRCGHRDGDAAQPSGPPEAVPEPAARRARGAGAPEASEPPRTAQPSGSVSVPDGAKIGIDKYASEWYNVITDEGSESYLSSARRPR